MTSEEVPLLIQQFNWSPVGFAPKPLSGAGLWLLREKTSVEDCDRIEIKAGHAATRETEEMTWISGGSLETNPVLWSSCSTCGIVNRLILKTEMFQTRWMSFSLTSRLAGIRTEFCNSDSLYLKPWLYPQTKGSRSIFNSIFKPLPFCVAVNFTEASKCYFFTNNTWKHFPSEVRLLACYFRTVQRGWAVGSDFPSDRWWRRGRDLQAQKLDVLYSQVWKRAVREGAGAGLGTPKFLIKVSFLEQTPTSLKKKINIMIYKHS